MKTLSDKRHRGTGEMWFYFEEDVKKFIKDLKKFFEDWHNDKQYPELEWINAKINELAGDKLI